MELSLVIQAIPWQEMRRTRALSPARIKTKVCVSGLQFPSTAVNHRYVLVLCSRAVCVVDALFIGFLLLLSPAEQDRIENRRYLIMGFRRLGFRGLPGRWNGVYFCSADAILWLFTQHICVIEICVFIYIYVSTYRYIDI